MPTKRIHHDEPKAINGFDVVCIVGHVRFDNLHGTLSPYEAAFRIIGEAGFPGVFEFPDSIDTSVTVTVVFNRPTSNDERTAENYSGEYNSFDDATPA